MSIKELAERAKNQVAEVTGLKPLNISGISKEGQGWHITLDMLEMSRVPSSTDVVGEYDLLLDDEGNLLRFGRKRSRLRGEPMEEKERV